MDLNYQKSKDEESYQREIRLRSHLGLQPKPLPRQAIATEAPSNKPKPPIRPRRIIKSCTIIQTGVGQSNSQANQIEKTERKRIAPSQVLNPSGSLDAQTPSLQSYNLLWFQRTQLPRLAKPVPCWLHGFATRREAEQLLQDKQQGCFLLRLSESTVGFVLSYRGKDKCRHFIIDVQCDPPEKEGCYIIAGEKSKHRSLEALINYYTHNPVGSFNETLTVPCIQPNVTCNDKPKMEMRNPLEKDEEKEATSSYSCSRQSSSSISTPVDVFTAQEPVQYAVVKKPLRKSLSLSEGHPECDVVQFVQELLHRKASLTNSSFQNTPRPEFCNTAICLGEDITQPVDVPYARVNKPQRPAQPSSIEPTDACTWGASAATESQFLSEAAAVNEQKYYQLEAVHLYEEALNTRDLENDDFNMVGRRIENRRGADFPANHVYSEVNIKGIRDDPTAATPPLWTGTTFINTQSSTRPVPIPPPRSNLHQAHSSVQAEISTQNADVTESRNLRSNQSEQLLAEDSDLFIYEQIPERSNKSRPQLPPLISKR